MTTPIPCVVWTTERSLVTFAAGAGWVAIVLAVAAAAAPRSVMGVSASFGGALVLLLVTVGPWIWRWRAPELLVADRDHLRLGARLWKVADLEARVVAHDDGDYVELRAPTGTVLFRPATGPLQPAVSVLERAHIHVSRGR
jgi:hypothetical protein